MLSVKWTWLPFLPVRAESLSRLAPWFVLLLLVMFTYSLADLSWRLWPVEVYPEPSILAVQTSSSSSLSSPLIVGLDEVASLHLFGSADVSPDTASAPVIAPETRLNMTLKGLVAAVSQQEARALIAQGNSSEEVYRVGQAVPGGATLHEIHADRVILLRAGRFETLTLPKERMDMSSASAANDYAQGGGRSQATGGVAQQLRELRDTLIQSPQDAMQFINAQPVMDAGQVRGYRVRPGRDRRLFNDVGLRPGDIVTAVNGISLSDPAQFGALFQQISSASTLNITVDRRGRQTELNLNLE